MRKSSVLCVAATTVVLLTIPPLGAHHSYFATYETGKTERLEGRVVQVDWRNPHVYVQMEVASVSSKDAARVWKVELSPARVLTQNGWTRDLVRPGMEIAVDGFRARDGSPAFGSSVVTIKSTGQVLDTPITPWMPPTP